MDEGISPVIEDPIHLSVDDGIVRLAIRNPGLPSLASVEQLDPLLLALESPTLDRASALVMECADDAFWPWLDLGIRRGSAEGRPGDDFSAMVTALNAVVRRLRSLPLPVVAAVEGPAVGPWLSLALSADLCVVARSAAFVPSSLMAAGSPFGGVSYFLVRALGPARAMSVLLRNEPIDAPTLVKQGLATEMVADGEAVTAATVLARRVGAGVTRSELLAARRFVDFAPTQGLATPLD